MSFFKTFMNGEQGLFKPDSLTPMQKIVLRFVVVGLVFYAFAVIEGMIMRLYEIGPFDAVTDDQFFAILTAHPLVGIFGSTYSKTGQFPYYQQTKTISKPSHNY